MALSRATVLQGLSLWFRLLCFSVFGDTAALPFSSLWFRLFSVFLQGIRLLSFSPSFPFFFLFPSPLFSSLCFPFSTQSSLHSQALRVHHRAAGRSATGIGHGLSWGDAVTSR